MSGSKGVLLNVAKNGRILYAIAYEERPSKGAWRAMPITYMHGSDAGEVQFFFTSARKMQTRIISIGPAVGSFDSGERKTVYASGIRADEVKPVGIA